MVAAFFGELMRRESLESSVFKPPLPIPRNVNLEVFDSGPR